MERDICEDLMRALYKKWGQPTIDFFGDQWRVWWQQIHVHRDGVSGDLSGYGRTLVDAMRRAMAQEKDIVREKPCRECELGRFD